MKAIILFLVLAAACTSQSEDDLEFNQENLVGTWTLTETLVDPGDGSGTFKKVEDGYSFTFKADGSFTSTRLQECQMGTYRIEENSKLVFNYDCDDFTEVYEDTASFSGDDLITSPVFPSRCIEACQNKFRKK